MVDYATIKKSISTTSGAIQPDPGLDDPIAVLIDLPP